jgi:hypothetical protein
MSDHWRITGVGPLTHLRYGYSQLFFGERAPASGPSGENFAFCARSHAALDGNLPRGHAGVEKSLVVQRIYDELFKE